MKHFAFVDEWGTLLPDTRGLRLRIPSWTLLIVALPLLVVAVLAAFTNLFPLQIVFGIPGGLFLALWVIDRRVSKKFGLIRINRNTKVAVFTDRDGAEKSIHFNNFLSLKIERVNIPKAASWRAVLCGEGGNLVLETISTQRRLIKWLTPVANWLSVPIEISSEEIGLEWLASPNYRTDPYPPIQIAEP